MHLEFVDRLPKMATGANRGNTTREDVLDTLVDTLAGDPGTWAVYPFELVRPDLADVDQPTKNKKVQSHLRQIQTRVKHSEAPFDEYAFEFAVRQGVGFIRVKPLTARESRVLGL